MTLYTTKLSADKITASGLSFTYHLYKDCRYLRNQQVVEVVDLKPKQRLCGDCQKRSRKEYGLQKFNT